MLFQMCNGSFSEFDSALDFGTRYRKKCKIQVHQLWSRPEPIFYDMYIPYRITGTFDEDKLFAVPILIKNLGDNSVRLQVYSQMFIRQTFAFYELGKYEKR